MLIWVREKYTNTQVVASGKDEENTHSMVRGSLGHFLCLLVVLDNGKTCMGSLK